MLLDHGGSKMDVVGSWRFLDGSCQFLEAAGWMLFNKT